ncbi:hypothetical protein [Tepidibacter formicigenes]|jgi:hypothetical protein|uniref:Uncharacterized protein n=1 Tax=Tepidibacter formicigenes DSM 15518 TaxID=1123349 RepID=A0A1M6LKG6_9FIRM|nr:hypothetical protein [Tepidibacter formicigenes]SHJ71673.1 hypothetical protein SAMN02744037_00668 [Tepidibacter formicigenes DSM 15518]
MKKKNILIIGLFAIFILLFFLTNKFKEDEFIQNKNVLEENIREEEILEEKEEVNFEKLMRTDNQGNVDVGVLINNIEKEDENYLVFKVMLNTHSVDLEGIDYAKLVNIKNSEGLIVKEGFLWEQVGGSGHHIYGYLKVPKEYNGESIINENTEYIELEIKELDKVESRKFVWNKNEIDLIKK